MKILQKIKKSFMFLMFHSEIKEIEIITSILRGSGSIITKEKIFSEINRFRWKKGDSLRSGFMTRDEFDALIKLT